MESLVSLAFKDLVSRFDETTVLEPESVKDLMDIYAELKVVFRDFWTQICLQFQSPFEPVIFQRILILKKITIFILHNKV